MDTVDNDDGLSLDRIVGDAWQALRRGAVRARHPFHTGVLGTVGGGEPALRTVVLRDADPDNRIVLCHTDIRSAKLEQLRTTSRAAWLFYDPGAKVQLRLAGDTEIHHMDGVARERWRGSSAWSRRCYGVDPGPGTPIRRAGSGLPDESGDRPVDIERTEAWFDRFAVITCVVDRLDWLRLAASGHLRARFDWRDGAWASSWVVP